MYRPYVVCYVGTAAGLERSSMDALALWLHSHGYSIYEYDSLMCRYYRSVYTGFVAAVIKFFCTTIEA